MGKKRKLAVGDTAFFSKTISEFDVYSFAGISGDFNPVHINAVYAENIQFGKRIAHGVLIASLISNVLGTKLPGEGTIFLEQNLKFKKPVYIGDTCTAKVIVAEIINEEKGIYKLFTSVENQDGENVIEGYAIVKY